MGRGLLLLMMLAAGAWAQLPKSQLDLQREAASGLLPAEIELRQNAAPPQGAPRLLRIRVYAARDYRAQTFNWQSRFSRLLGRVNRALDRWPHVRLEVADVRLWERDTAVPLGPLVDELVRADPGRDVDFVVGLAVAVPSLPEQIHNLGMARQLGRHFVLRSLHDLAEYEAVRGAFDQMSPAERERLMALRKAHKEVVVFLHELFHTLGLIHAQRWQRIMNPSYHHGQSQLSDTEVQMLQLGLDRRDDPGWHGELLQLIQRQPDAEWDPRDRDQLRALLSGAAAVTSHGGASPSAAPTDVLRECQQLASHPPLFAIRKLDATCALAAQLDASDPVPVLWWAEGEVRQHLPARADEILTHAEVRLSRRGSVDGWRRAAELRQALDEPTAALEDAAKGGLDLQAWADKARTDWLLPSESKLSPAREGEYVRQVQVALQALDGDQEGVVELMAHQLSQEFAELPAAPLLRCWLLLRRKGDAGLCLEALAKAPDSPLAQRLKLELGRRRRR